MRLIALYSYNNAAKAIITGRYYFMFIFESFVANVLYTMCRTKPKCSVHLYNQAGGSMKKQNLKQIIAVAILIIATIPSMCCCENKRESDISTQNSTTDTSIIVDNLSTTESTNSFDWSQTTTTESKVSVFDLSDIPSYSSEPYYEVNNNKPFFQSNELSTNSFKQFSELDLLGRCGVAFACIGCDSLPTEERGAIGMIKPSGWHTVRYDDIIEDKYLYNRCHLIAFELSGENANPKNLITGTRYLNIKGMLPFENTVRSYVEDTNQHVMYRVTPVFEGDNLVAAGVLMEGYSVEDNGAGICFNVFCYNVQPGIKINYLDGTSEIASVPEPDENPDKDKDDSTTTYVLNTNTNKFHYPYCDSVNKIKEKNKQITTEDREIIIERGYSPCGKCKP